MTFLKTLPAALASLLLGAHFLRSGSLLLVLGCLILLPLCFVRRSRIRKVVRGTLYVGVVIWLATAMRIVGLKMDAGQPAGLSLVILLGVAAFTGVAAWLLPSALVTAEADLPSHEERE